MLEASGVTLARQAQLGSDEKLIVGTGTGARAAAAAALDCARQGERALIVCRDEGVLRELKKAIKLIGIGDLALAISESTSQEELRKELVRTLALEQPAKPPTGDFAGQLKTVNTKLEEYRQMLASILSGSIDPRSAGLSDTLMLRALLRSCVGQFELEALRTLPSDKRAGVLNLAQRLQDHLTAHGSPQANPFLGSGVRTEDLSPGSTIQDSLAAAAGSSAVYAEEFRVFAAELGLSVHLQDQHNLAALKALAVVEATFTANGANMRHVDFDSDKWTAGESQLISALERARHFRHLIESYPDPINLQALAALDLDSAEEVFSKGKIGRLLSLDYRGLREDLAAVTRVPEDASGQQLVLSKLKEIRAVQRQMRGDEKLWSELYGDSLVQLRSEVPELRYWQHLSQLTERLIEFSKLTSEHPEREHRQGDEAHRLEQPAPHRALTIAPTITTMPARAIASRSQVKRRPAPGASGGVVAAATGTAAGGVTGGGATGGAASAAGAAGGGGASTPPAAGGAAGGGAAAIGTAAGGVASAAGAGVASSSTGAGCPHSSQNLVPATRGLPHSSQNDASAMREIVTPDGRAPVVPNGPTAARAREPLAM
ncbi:MAG: hypothetical protein DCC75_03235, partial [Proteobacteria bacterium]